jgi:hypothetical protein
LRAATKGDPRARRVEQWAKDVEGRAEGQRAPCWGHGGERWVILPRGKKGERDAGNWSEGYRARRYENAPKGLEEAC